MSDPSQEFKHISAADTKQLMQNPAAVIVDIRDEQSFAAGRITGAVPLDSAGVHAFIAEADMDAPVIVCCYHGHSSQPAAAYLAAQGFDDVYSLDGGFTEWQQLYPDQCERDMN